MEAKTKDLVHKLESSIPPTILTIFGATGDLSLSYLFPALIHLHKSNLLPTDFRLVCVGRREYTQDEFREFIKTEEKKRSKIEVTPDFLNLLTYFKTDFDTGAGLSGLSTVLADHATSNKDLCFNRLYYFATLPSYFEPLSKSLKKAGLLTGCRDHKRTIRVLIEKPFGEDYKSAKSLNKTLLSFFKEEQIYRIDHYLGKETVQNIFTVRFANDLFEPVWNNKYIDHIEISALESDGVGGRINFYEKTGALKDFVQNHLLNILALVVMDRPESLNPEAIRDKKVSVLKSLVPFTKGTIKKDLVRAQYSAGMNTEGYLSEAGKNSNTETYVAFKTFLKLPKWKGVPVYLRNGKRLENKVSEVSVHFKKAKHELFIPTGRESNVLTFRLQPMESVSISVNNKIPGFGMRLHPGKLNFGYEQFHSEIPGAYERLLLDFCQGDQRLFIRSDEIEAAWKFIESISKNLHLTPMGSYMPFSEGPKSAVELMKKDKRTWWTK